MKKIVAGIITAGLLVSGAFAKTDAPKKYDVQKDKKSQITALKSKVKTIEKRISCIEDAKSKKDLKECAKKAPLIKVKAKNSAKKETKKADKKVAKKETKKETKKVEKKETKKVEKKEVKKETKKVESKN
ncbi:MAG: Unknown protein [uncultured Sulfurovum sp.]|uniref:Uncharacterized protein n=1 Tax=uncultured Sulfurovum sp. TaxID=269237 RepID=A0A6S6T103_9BACT|nr:MAG: Unknown protein [uncultured Sulfurovum sp.]